MIRLEQTYTYYMRRYFLTATLAFVASSSIVVTSLSTVPTLLAAGSNRDSVNKRQNTIQNNINSLPKNANNAKNSKANANDESKNSPKGEDEAPTTTTTLARLRIIQINDVYQLDNFASLKTLMDHYEKEATINNIKEERDAGFDSKCIRICAGDFLAPSLLSSLDQGFAMVDMLQAVGFDYVCLGNHETDVGDEALKQRILQSSMSTTTTTSNTDKKPLVWINSNLPELNKKLQVQTPEFVTLQLGNNVQVALLGLLTEDPSLYRPGAFGGATIQPLLETAEVLYSPLAKTHTTVLAMTHQSIHDDRTMAQHLGGSSKIPLLMGGHDHEPYVENNVNNNNGCCHIVKAGMDAEQAAIIDLTWTSKTTTTNNAAATAPTIHVQLVDTNSFAPCPIIQERVTQHQAILKELDSAQLFAVQDWVVVSANDDDDDCAANKGNSNGSKHHDNDDDECNNNRVVAFSTKNNRLGPSTGTTALCSMVRMGLRCQVAFLNAGSVRCDKVYDQDHQFTWSDLKGEMPFATEMVVCRLPGAVLQETLQHSRQYAPQNIAKGGYLHTSRTTVCRDDGTILSILGQPFDPNQSYITAFPYAVLQGMDNHVPILEWAKTVEPSNLPNGRHVAVPVKYIIVQVFSTLLWLHLGEFPDIAGDDGVISKDDLNDRLQHVYGKTMAALMVDNIFSMGDIDQSGTISALEMMMVHFAATDMLDHVATAKELEVMTSVAQQVTGHTSNVDHQQLAQQLKDALDIKGNGKIERDEILQLLGQVERKDLLE